MPRYDEEYPDLTASLEVSYHYKHRQSNWVFVGGINRALTEGDLMVVFSQMGEIMDIELARTESGHSKGYCFIEYVTFPSAVLAVDNLNGIILADKKIGVTHSTAPKIGEQREEARERRPGGVR
ncbi:RNA recognition motif containing protein [Carpediemonas membranifera]|uniref:RNA recognition motif containing protein n=1 Tax=Carpediemonas membranifera TaxID=201153 RepID=A0A8J6ART6_9EUKA|nr:RNA recognition motif containing protein [Carpediemonas membranifera]|eukprot:KAG9392383.1 RNA recognition motif containing protein [Carpediemonas membranifera]